MKDLIEKVKQKREFSGLPDKIIENVLNQKQIKNKPDEEKVKLSRAFLRKYFGVFMTNKVLKGKDEKVLESHISSKKRDYSEFYKRISSIAGNNFKSVIDLGCGMNGFSYNYIRESFGDVKYVGIEATRQLCNLQNEFFNNSGILNANVVWGDLFNYVVVKDVFKESKSPRIILLLQVIDALENIEPNFAKGFLNSLIEYMDREDVLIISNSMKSISGKNRFDIKRRWLDEFVKSNFNFIDKFELFDEEFLVAKRI